MEGCYVPNNPQYGLVELSPSYSTGVGGKLCANGLLSGGKGSDSTTYGGCGSLSGSLSNLTNSGGSVGAGGCGNGGVYWSTDDMGSFSLPGLDLDPLPSLFPFSPCSANTYKNDFPVKEKQPHDMADVLLSLKHAVVHPGQSGQLSPVFSGYNTGTPQGSYQVPSASLSYTVHPHQMMSPGGGYGSSQYCTGSQDQFCSPGPTQNMHTQHHNMFPSMSVNVSMNMTMHGYPTPGVDNLQHQMAACPQMQWGPIASNPSPVYTQQQGLLSPQSYSGGATYSFTADFRAPPPLPDLAQPILSNPSYKPKLSPFLTTSPIRSSKRAPKPMPAVEDSHRPNLCRICGKTYARPSTLKTHLRTHSGEKPYRCGDCNKTFSQAANLTAHVRTHSGEKPFRCPICDRRFSQSSSVTTHMRTHSGERPYRCRMCKKAFSDSSTLTKHLRIHSGEKPYQCKLCLLRFSQSGNLNRHMRVHGGMGNIPP